MRFLPKLIDLGWSKTTPMAWKSTWQLRDTFLHRLLSPTHANKYWRLRADKSNSDLHPAWPCPHTMEHTMSKICLCKQKMFLPQWYIAVMTRFRNEEKSTKCCHHCEKYSPIQLMIAMPIVSIPVMVAFPAALGVYWVSNEHCLTIS